MTEIPVIGISTYRQPADWSTWNGVEADILPAAYAQSVVAVGGVAVLVPPLDSVSAARAVVKRLDGLVIAGGADVNPARYGAAADPAVIRWYDNRDASELWLLDAAREVAIPVLGICRGMQLMAVQAGGVLIQHLPDAVGHARHAGDGNEYGAIPVTVEPGHRISSLVDPTLMAQCHHHQSVASHPGYVATARDSDGVLQAMEAEGERFELAVQWHPEAGEDKGLFAGLVSAARAGAVTRPEL